MITQFFHIDTSPLNMPIGVARDGLFNLFFSYEKHLWRTSSCQILKRGRCTGQGRGLQELVVEQSRGVREQVQAQYYLVRAMMVEVEGAMVSRGESSHSAGRKMK